ncbi:hypothetical protein BV25DRAFT_1734601 [Artomyces pyxidatus]|uniref:Uncharacterized protein n=1 Tax=Artomyces pyxidatus TaxID=48021 RepID=A0ACB8SIR2_9AGAM|nr:hypothetical protein BV25DRAFT_1734601 [Artomyces pyxidatus]
MTCASVLTTLPAFIHRCHYTLARCVLMFTRHSTSWPTETRTQACPLRAAPPWRKSESGPQPSACRHPAHLQIHCHQRLHTAQHVSSIYASSWTIIVQRSPSDMHASSATSASPARLTSRAARSRGNSTFSPTMS